MSHLEIARALVPEFIKAFDASTDRELWVRLVMEEAKELLEATERVDQLKEACDFLYVCAGTEAATTGPKREMTAYEEPIMRAAAERFDEVREGVGEVAFIQAFTRVHQSNMSKLGDDGKPVRRADGKIMKSENYKPPYLDDLISKETI